MEKSRIYISKENLAKLSKEEKEFLKKQKVHICLALEPEDSLKPSYVNSFSELRSQIEMALKTPRPSGEQTEEVLNFQ